MKIIKCQGLEYFQFESLVSPTITQGVFSRKGGVSQAPWSSLNLGGTVGDHPEHVNENLQRLLNCLGYSNSQLAQVRQIHSTKVIRIDAPTDAFWPGDGMITDQPGLLLLMRYADCVPILFYDSKYPAVGIAHAGWKGTLNGIAYQVVRKMENDFGTVPGSLKVAIGPSIGPDHYQIGQDVLQEVEKTFPDNEADILIQEGDSVKLDLWEANRLMLKKAGVNQIEIGGICTGCDLDHWYSHRVEKGRTGRFAAVIGLVKE